MEVSEALLGAVGAFIPVPLLITWPKIELLGLITSKKHQSVVLS